MPFLLFMRIILLFVFSCRILMWKAHQGDDLKSSLDGDVSEELMMEMLDPFSVGTLTLVRMIETFVESVFATVLQTIYSSGSFLFFWWGWLCRIALHKVTWSKWLYNKLKVTISPLSEIKSESELCTVPFHGNPLNSICKLYSNGRNCCCGYQNYAYELALEIWFSVLQNPYTNLAKIYESSAFKTGSFIGMDHWKDERVSYRDGIQDVRNFGPSETQKLSSVQSWFCLEIGFSS
jgi:hypothetical protein